MYTKKWNNVQDITNPITRLVKHNMIDSCSIVNNWFSEVIVSESFESADYNNNNNNNNF
jgi:hypothetical protein